MEIVLGVGVGEILFGLTEAQVLTMLGSPDRSYLTPEDFLRVQFD